MGETLTPDEEPAAHRWLQSFCQADLVLLDVNKLQAVTSNFADKATDKLK